MGKTLSEEAKVKASFDRACVDYHLLEDGDRILVAVSGGKDSLALLRLLALRSRIYKPQIVVEAAHVVMDNIPYETDSDYLQQFCDDLGVKLHILHSHFDESTDHRKTHCFLCAWHRRKALFQFAEQHHYNKVALGHHQDDFLVTLLLNLTFEGAATSMRPRMRMEHYDVEIIRPLCLTPEAHIVALATALAFADQKRRCPYEHETNRSRMPEILHQLELLNPEARQSLWHALMRQ